MSLNDRQYLPRFLCNGNSNVHLHEMVDVNASSHKLCVSVNLTEFVTDSIV